MAEKTADEWTDEQIKEWNEWVESRPPEIQKAIKEHPPGVYKLKLDDGSESSITYQLIGYTENDDGSEATVILTTEGFMGMFPRQVVGVQFADLIPVNTWKTRADA